MSSYDAYDAVLFQLKNGLLNDDQVLEIYCVASNKLKDVRGKDD